MALHGMTASTHPPASCQCGLQLLGMSPPQHEVNIKLKFAVQWPLL